MISRDENLPAVCGFGFSAFFFFILLRPQLSEVLNLRSPSTPVSLGLFTGLITPLHQGLSQTRWMVLFFSSFPSNSILQQVLPELFKELKFNQGAEGSPTSSAVSPLLPQWRFLGCTGSWVLCQGTCVPACRHPCASITETTSKEECFFFFKLDESNQICINDRHMYTLL